MAGCSPASRPLNDLPRRRPFSGGWPSCRFGCVHKGHIESARHTHVEASAHRIAAPNHEALRQPVDCYPRHHGPLPGFHGRSYRLGQRPAWFAAVAAAIAGSLALSSFRREQRRDKVAQELRLREQSSKFSGWLEERNHQTILHLKNASELPIEQVNGWFWSGEPYGQTFNDVLEKYCEMTWDRVVPPGTLLSRPLDFDATDDNFSLSFTDAQGIFWVRHNGTLETATYKTQPRWYQAFDFEPQSIFGSLYRSVRMTVSGAFERFRR